MKYRNIGKVIEAIYKEVPENWKEREDFRKALDNVLDSASYRAPEAYVVNFEQLAGVLGDYLGTPNEEWKGNIANLFADKVKIPDMTYFEI
jgi:hypothetical protein